MCKKVKKKCKKACDAATPCPLPEVCKDNVPAAFGDFWCSSNKNDPAFCDSASGMKKCKKTCDRCD